MTEKRTLKKLKLDMSDVLLGAHDEHLDEVIQLVKRHYVDDNRRSPRDLESDITDGLPWKYHYEDAVASVVRAECRNDPDIKSFRAEALPSGLLDSAESALNWVQLVSGQSVIEPIHHSSERNQREHEERIVQRMPCREGKIVLPVMDRMIGIFNAISIPPNPAREIELLKSTAVRVAERYGWLEEVATLKILTDIGLATPALLATIRYNDQTPSMTKIVIEVDPSLKPEAVTEIYRTTRNRLKTRWHSMSVKHLKLAEFVARRTDLKSWRDRWNEWNSFYNQWSADRPSGWAYKPPLPMRSWNDEEMAAINASIAEKTKGRASKRFSFNRETVDYDAIPPDFELQIENGYHNFRRDAARARLRLLDPYNWKPKKRKDTENG